MYIVPGNEFLTYLAGKSLYHAYTEKIPKKNKNLEYLVAKCSKHELSNFVFKNGAKNCPLH